LYARRLNIEDFRPPQAAFQGDQGEGAAHHGDDRAARLYLLDEPIGGVDPETRDYFLNTIIGNYIENPTF
jgi:ABC-2 type transport system ATP-binding protein